MERRISKGNVTLAPGTVARVSANAQVRAGKNCVVNASALSSVIARDNAVVRAYDNSVVFAYGKSKVIIIGKPRVFLHDQASAEVWVDQGAEIAVEWAIDYDIKVGKNGKTTFRAKNRAVEPVVGSCFESGNTVSKRSVCGRSKSQAKRIAVSSRKPRTNNTATANKLAG